MAAISIGETATAGIRLLRERPVLLAFWAVPAILAAALSVAVSIGMTQPALAQLSASGAEPSQVMAAAGRSFGATLVLFAISLFTAVVTATAANRAILTPEDSAFGYLRLGVAELRTLVVLFVIGILMVVAYIALIMVGVIMAGVVGVSGKLAAGDLASGIVMVILLVLLIPLVLGALLAVATRLSLALPQTFATRRINIFGSWEMTKGRTGALFVAYLLAALMCLGITLVFTTIVMATGLNPAFKAFEAMGDQDPKAVSDLLAGVSQFGPLRIVSIVLGGVVNAVILAIIACPAAFAYRRLSGDSEAEVFA